MSREESLDSLMKKKERIRLATKRQNCVVVVVAGVVCQNGDHGGSTYTVAQAEKPRVVEDPSEVYSMSTS